MRAVRPGEEEDRGPWGGTTKTTEPGPSVHHSHPGGSESTYEKVSTRQGWAGRKGLYLYSPNQQQKVKREFQFYEMK